MEAGRRRSLASEPVLVLLGITMVALALRLPSFGNSLGGDELSTNFVVHGFGAGNLFEILQSDQEGTPPLFFLLTWLTKGLGETEGLRVVSLLAGLAAIPLTYLLGERTVGRPAGMVGAALVALGPFQIFYATEGRAFALVMVFCLVASLTLLVALDSGRARWWVAFGLSVAAAAYTQYSAIFVLIALFAWALIARPDAWKPLVAAGAGAVLLYLPWIPSLLDDRTEPASKILDLVHPFSVDSALADLLHWSIGHPWFSGDVVPGHLAELLIAAAVALGAAGLIIGLAQRRLPELRPPSAELLLIPLLAIASPLGAAIHQVFAASVFYPPSLIASWPALALTAGALVTTPRGPLRIAAVGLLLGGFAIGASKTLDEDNQQADFAGVVDFIESNGDSDSPVVDLPQGTPGPQSPLEAAFAPKGEAGPAGREIFELGFPSLQRRLDTRLEAQPLADPLRTLSPGVPSSAETAKRAARIAGSGPIFLVSWGPTSLEEQASVPGRVSEFLAALPPRFEEVEARTFSGPLVLTPTVYVLSGSGAPGH